jgi:hypothetical protein
LQDFRIRRILSIVQERYRGHDHSRGAIRALHRTFVEESLLHRVQAVFFRKTFDGNDGFAGECGNWSRAGAMRATVNQNRASSTLTFAAPILRPG